MAAPAGAAGDGDADANGVELSTAVAASFDGRSQCECAICACTLTEAPPAPAPAPAPIGDDANAAADAEDGTEDSAPVAFPAAPAWAWSSSFTFPCCHNSDCCVRCAAEWVGHQADEELRRPHPRAAPESALPADLISCPFCRSSDPVAMNNTVERLIKAVKRVPKVEASAVGSETFAASGTVDEEGRERILKDLRRARGALAVLRGDTENAELGMLERSEHQAEGGHGRCETQVKRALRTSGVALRICGITVLGIVELIFCCSYGRFEDM